VKRRIAIVVLALLASLPAAAQDSLETAKRRELEDIRRQAQESRDAAAQLKGQEGKALVRLRRTEHELTETRKRLRALQSRRELLDRKLEDTSVDLQRSQRSLGSQREKLSRRLRGLYKFGAARELEFLLSTRTFAQLLARWDFLVMVAEQDRVLLEDIEAKKEVVEANKNRLESNRTEIDRNTQRTHSENERLAALRSERATSVKTIQSRRQAYEAAAAELEKTARAIQRLLTQLERKRKEEAARAKSQGLPPQPYTGDFAKGHGHLDWPLRGEVVGTFGPEKHPKWGTVTLNNGIDIASPIGAPVHSVAKGRVEYVSEDFGTYGQMIVLNHGDGYYTLYGHLSEIDVTVGQEVVAGQSIARSGDSGSLKGPILHFEVRKGGTSLNPQEWLQ
jgi:septal ring factor EnvC (AmiA/AmiB activator)